jgi:hypothetical protein
LGKRLRGGIKSFVLKRYFFFLLAEDFLLGTLPPDRRASDNPIAIACFRLLTLLPDRPLFRVPRFRSPIARLTFFDAVLPYLAMTAPPLRLLSLQLHTIKHVLLMTLNKRITSLSPFAEYVRR